MTNYRESDDATRKAFDAALRDSHRIRTQVKLYASDDRDEPGVPLEGLVVEGQVDCALDGETTRTLSLTIMDPTDKFRFEGLGMGAVYADDYIGVEYGVYVEDLAEWVDVDVFFGPVSRFSRNGAEVTLEAVGKEGLLRPPVKQIIPSYDPADRYLKTVVKDLAREFGETKFRLALMTGKKVPGGFAIDAGKIRERGTWWYMQELAATRNLRLEYGGDGYLEARPLNPRLSAYTFRDALTEPTLDFDLAETRNRVEVWDQDKKGNPDPVVRLDLPSSHPLSADSLGRNGKPRVLLEKVELSVVKTTVADAENIARGILYRHSMGALAVSFDHLVVPHLTPGDHVALRTLDGRDNPFKLTSFTIPLTAEDAMSVGYTRPVRLKSGKFKYRRRILK